jgi:hypothetical protein
MNCTDSTESDAALKELIAKYQAIDPYLIAEAYAFRNQSDEAFEWLDRAYAQHEGNVAYTNELAQRPALCRILEEAQPAELKYVAILRARLQGRTRK